jgi:transcriptional activator SPT8
MIGKASCVHPCPINGLSLTKNSKWLFTAGDDGFIRKFDFPATVNGELNLTQINKLGDIDFVFSNN